MEKGAHIRNKAFFGAGLRGLAKRKIKRKRLYAHLGARSVDMLHELNCKAPGGSSFGRFCVRAEQRGG